MDFLPMSMLIQETNDCSFNEQDIHRCPFLRNINEPTNFSFATLNCPIPSKGSRGPIFEDAPNFQLAFKLFHGKDGVVPLCVETLGNEVETEAVPQFNPLASRAASISMSAFGPGGPFGFHSLFGKMHSKNLDSSKNKDQSSKGDSSKHEALGNEWLETGNCPIAKSYRAVSSVLPLVAATLRPPPGIKLKCPPAVVAARAALAKTAFVKSMRPQPLPAKVLVIGLLGIAANIPLGVWREHTEKFSLPWFTAIHAAIPFIAMLRKSVVMPKTAMALTIAGSVLGQMIGSRAERLRLKAISERKDMMEMTKAPSPPSPASEAYNSSEGNSTLATTTAGICGRHRHGLLLLETLPSRISEAPSSPASVCF